MSWIRKSPFADGSDPAEHMVALIAAESERCGTPLSEVEKKILLAHWDRETTVSEDFRAKAKKLIEQTLLHEADPGNSLSLGNSVGWAGDGAFPTVVASAEEVMLEGGEKPRLRGKRAIIDLAQLVGCGFVSVILLTFLRLLSVGSSDVPGENDYREPRNGFRIVNFSSISCPSCISSVYKVAQ